MIQEQGARKRGRDRRHDVWLIVSLADAFFVSQPSAFPLTELAFGVRELGQRLVRSVMPRLVW